MQVYITLLHLFYYTLHTYIFYKLKTDDMVSLCWTKLLVLFSNITCSLPVSEAHFDSSHNNLLMWPLHCLGTKVCFYKSVDSLYQYCMYVWLFHWRLAFPLIPYYSLRCHNIEIKLVNKPTMILRYPSKRKSMTCLIKQRLLVCRQSVRTIGSPIITQRLINYKYSFYSLGYN